MNKIVTITIATLMILGAASCNSSNKNSVANNTQPLSLRQKLDTITRAISPEIAILIAETFVAEQGYTQKPINLKTQTLQFEKGEYASDTNQIVKMRYNTLHDQAIGVRQYGDKNEKWAVGFKPIHGENNVVRAVTMDTIAKMIIMQSQNMREDWVLGKVQ